MEGDFFGIVLLGGICVCVVRGGADASVHTAGYGPWSRPVGVWGLSSLQGDGVVSVFLRGEVSYGEGVLAVLWECEGGFSEIVVGVCFGEEGGSVRVFDFEGEVEAGGFFDVCQGGLADEFSVPGECDGQLLSFLCGDAIGVSLAVVEGFVGPAGGAGDGCVWPDASGVEEVDGLSGVDSAVAAMGVPDVFFGVCEAVGFAEEVRVGGVDEDGFEGEGFVGIGGFGLCGALHEEGGDAGGVGGGVAGFAA